MPGAFQGISTAGSALRAFQAAMQVTGNNLANVNTRGYSRQTVDFRANESSSYWSYGQKQIGNGVSIGAISRAKDLFQETRIRSALGNEGRSQTMRENMATIEGIYNEPGATGIGSSIDAFFNSWSSLASNPNDAAARWNLRQNASTMTDRVQKTFRQLQELEDGATVAIKDTILSVNSISENVAEINKQIRALQATGGQVTDLLDRRDLMIRELSSMVQVTTTEHRDGTVSIYTGNLPLVLQTSANKMPSNFDAANMTVTDGTNTYQVRGGQLQGNMETITRIKAAKADLDKLANEFKTAFNTVHKTGINGLGNTNVNFFEDVVSGPQTGAADFQLSADILADPKAIVTSITGAAGDGGLALALSQMRDTPRAALGSSLNQFYRNHVGGISQETAYYEANAEVQSDIVNQIDLQIQSISGVSIDEEMIELTKLQRSYQAAAKVLSILDQTTEDLINIIR